MTYGKEALVEVDSSLLVRFVTRAGYRTEYNRAEMILEEHGLALVVDTLVHRGK